MMDRNYACVGRVEIGNSDRMGGVVIHVIHVAHNGLE